jgi:two-component system, chemotaxis family, sensor kinase CheA
MPISKEKFLKLFLDEFRENLRVAENQIVLLKNDPANTDSLSALLRTLHTIKGSSRMLQFTKIEQAIHGAETVFKGVRDGRYAIDSRLVRFFFILADHLRAAALSIEAGQGDKIDALPQILDACEKLSANEAYDLQTIALHEEAPILTPSPAEKSASEEAKVELSKKREKKSATKVTESPANPKPAEAEMPASPAPAKSQPAETKIEGERVNAELSLDSSIRVNSETINKSISLVNTLSIRQLRLHAAAEEFDQLEKRLNELSREKDDIRLIRSEIMNLARHVRAFKNDYAEHIVEIDYGTEELRDSVIGMRMIPISHIIDMLPRMVEETAMSLGKEVLFSITGDSVRLDRTVLEKISDPLIHLVRNAVDHGIESPAAREAAGKPRQGKITLDCRTEGNRITVLITDDGAGLDYDKIRRKAIAQWPDDADDIRAMPDQDLVHFLFLPGFSTADRVSEISGRGVGLDIVKTNVEAVKGQIQLSSEPGRGCVFTLVLPVSASTMDGMFVLASGHKFFIPASTIKRTLLIQKSDCFKTLQREMYTLDGVNIPLSELSTSLQLEQIERKGSTLAVLLVQGAVERVGIIVDRILGYGSLVYQALPNSLKKNTVMQGVVFDDAFQIIPILNMWVVLDRLRSVRAMDTHKRFAARAEASKPNILVVDDSVSTREIEISMLELEGFDVIGAVDGLDALDKLHTGNFSLVVSDLNMPRMDGFKLLENLRNDEQFRALPVIFVTTVDDPALKGRAAELGVSKYILKSSFDQDNLISAVKELLIGVKS